MNRPRASSISAEDLIGKRFSFIPRGTHTPLEGYQILEAALDRYGRPAVVVLDVANRSRGPRRRIVLAMADLAELEHEGRLYWSAKSARLPVKHAPLADDPSCRSTEDATSAFPAARQRSDTAPSVSEAREAASARSSRKREATSPPTLAAMTDHVSCPIDPSPAEDSRATEEIEPRGKRWVFHGFDPFF
jgi:hypothetical protein